VALQVDGFLGSGRQAQAEQGSAQQGMPRVKSNTHVKSFGLE
jgi:hypothetical protein